MIKILLKAYPVAAAIPDPNSMLPIHHMAMWGPSSPGIVDILLRSNSFVCNVRSKDGKTPIDLATEADYSIRDEVVEALRNLSLPMPTPIESLKRRADLVVMQTVAENMKSSLASSLHVTDLTRKESRADLKYVLPVVCAEADARDDCLKPLPKTVALRETAPAEKVHPVVKASVEEEKEMNSADEKYDNDEDDDEHYNDEDGDDDSPDLAVLEDEAEERNREAMEAQQKAKSVINSILQQEDSIDDTLDDMDPILRVQTNADMYFELERETDKEANLLELNAEAEIKPQRASRLVEQNADATTCDFSVYGSKNIRDQPEINAMVEVKSSLMTKSMADLKSVYYPETNNDKNEAKSKEKKGNETMESQIEMETRKAELEQNEECPNDKYGKVNGKDSNYISNKSDFLGSEVPDSEKEARDSEVKQSPHITKETREIIRGEEKQYFADGIRIEDERYKILSRRVEETGGEGGHLVSGDAEILLGSEKLGTRTDALKECEIAAIKSQTINQGLLPDGRPQYGVPPLVTSVEHPLSIPIVSATTIRASNDCKHRPKSTIYQLFTEIESTKKEIEDLKKDGEFHEDSIKVAMHKKLAKQDKELASTRALISNLRSRLLEATAHKSVSKHTTEGLAYPVTDISTRILAMKKDNDRFAFELTKPTKIRKRRLKILQELLDRDLESERKHVGVKGGVLMTEMQEMVIGNSITESMNALSNFVQKPEMSIMEQHTTWKFRQNTRVLNSLSRSFKKRLQH